MPAPATPPHPAINIMQFRLPFRPASRADAPVLRNCLRIWTALILAAAFAASATPANAQATWPMATEYPKSNISGVGLATFSRLVSEYTGGRVTTTVAYDNALKITSAAMPQAVREMRIAGGDAFAGGLAIADPMFGLPSLPFVVQSVETARAVNALARPLYEKALQSRGLKLL